MASRVNGGWGFYDEAEFQNLYLNCQAATNTGGSYYALAGPAYFNCYVEGGTGSNVDISAPAVVVGGILSGVCAGAGGTNAHTGGPLPAIISGLGYNVLRALHITWNDQGSGDGALLAGDAGVISGSSTLGTCIQGRGGSADVALLNKNGQYAAYVPTAARDLAIVGNLTRDGLGTLVGSRAPAIANATGGIAHAAGANPTQAEYDALVDAYNDCVAKFNSLLGYLSFAAGTHHGLIG